MSICLSVTLVDCDHTVQQKVEIGTWQNRPMLVSWLSAHGSRPGSWYTVIMNATDVWKMWSFALLLSLLSSNNDVNTLLQHQRVWVISETAESLPMLPYRFEQVGLFKWTYIDRHVVQTVESRLHDHYILCMHYSHFRLYASNSTVLLQNTINSCISLIR